MENYMIFSISHRILLLFPLSLSLLYFYFTSMQTSMLFHPIHIWCMNIRLRIWVMRFARFLSHSQFLMYAQRLFSLLFVLFLYASICLLFMPVVALMVMLLLLWAFEFLFVFVFALCYSSGESKRLFHINRKRERYIFFSLSLAFDLII